MYSCFHNFVLVCKFAERQFTRLKNTAYKWFLFDKLHILFSFVWVGGCLHMIALCLPEVGASVQLHD